ncbi:hypothetical protein [Streptomyces sp. NPDC004284]|uniref:hypothetical protein n=1 Tax=Streptomyces sp. NPDC004284 TaxID=3364695 RepID=UPI0036BDDA43
MRYGDHVRIVDIGDFSRELCGGTHIGHSSSARPVRISGETSGPVPAPAPARKPAASSSRPRVRSAARARRQREGPPSSSTSAGRADGAGQPVRRPAVHRHTREDREPEPARSG